jgi:hypothetical protein
LSAYASLRFLGDRLQPERITKMLGAAPTLAYRKDEVFKRSRGQEVRGRTGLWLLSTRRQLDSTDLSVHLRKLIDVLFPAGETKLIGPLCNLMREDGLKADVSCFWYGERGAKPPLIADEVRAAFAQIGATIETDFDSD